MWLSRFFASLTLDVIVLPVSDTHLSSAEKQARLAEINRKLADLNAQPAAAAK